jgi:hypothetical protein
MIVKKYQTQLVEASNQGDYDAVMLEERRLVSATMELVHIFLKDVFARTRMDGNVVGLEIDDTLTGVTTWVNVRCRMDQDDRHMGHWTVHVRWDEEDSRIVVASFTESYEEQHAIDPDLV